MKLRTKRILRNERILDYKGLLPAPKVAKKFKMHINSIYYIWRSFIYRGKFGTANQRTILTHCACGAELIRQPKANVVFKCFECKRIKTSVANSVWKEKNYET